MKSNSVWFVKRGGESAEHYIGLSRPRAEEVYGEKEQQVKSFGGSVKLMSTKGEVLKCCEGE